jgi:hypothetical protein
VKVPLRHHQLVLEELEDALERGPDRRLPPGETSWLDHQRRVVRVEIDHRVEVARVDRAVGDPNHFD